jgi:branched-chain amino acid transport system permease protein
VHTLINLAVSGIILGSQISLIAVGFSSIEAIQRTFHFAHGGVLMIGGYVTWWLVTVPSVTAVLAAFCGVVVCAIVGVVMKHLVYDKLRALRTSGPLVMISSMAMFLIVVNAIGAWAGASPRVISNSFSSKSISVIDGLMSLTPIELTEIGIALAAIAVSWLLLRVGRLGRTLRCVIDDPDSALVLGLPVRLIEFGAFAFGSALAGLAGALSAFSPGLDLGTPFLLLLFGITAAVAAGVRNVPVTGLAGFGLGLVLDLPLAVLPHGYRTTIAFAFLVALLYWRPASLSLASGTGA